MIAEVERDIGDGGLYLSPRLTDSGRIQWPGLLLNAVRSGDEATLAESLMGRGLLRAFEDRRSSRGWGRAQQVRVPRTAAWTLSEGEFNRFYIRGLCVRAVEGGVGEVEVYRAKHVDNPRSESLYLIGRRLGADALLEDLRLHSGEEEPAFRVPGGPNSGLSVRLPQSIEGQCDG
jgi:hypothetical protein